MSATTFPAERPILFKGEMVRAVLEDRKTQTRRLLQLLPVLGWPEDWAPMVISEPATFARLMGDYRRFCPYGDPAAVSLTRGGPKLWVKETWRPSVNPGRGLVVRYAADATDRAFGPEEVSCTWTMPKAAARGNVSPLFMPRWASRVLLDVVDVRVEHLQAITEEDARAEGAQPWRFGPEQTLTSGERGADSPYRSGFACLWDGINGDVATWKSNPFVWVITFRRTEGAT